MVYAVKVIHNLLWCFSPQKHKNQLSLVVVTICQKKPFLPIYAFQSIRLFSAAIIYIQYLNASQEIFLFFLKSICTIMTLLKN